MTVSSDAEVIAASLADPSRFGEIFDRHAQSIFRYLGRRIGADHADDVMGDVFLAAFASRGSYDLARGSALPWLYGIAANLLGKHFRQQAVELRALARLRTTDRIDDPMSAVAASIDSRNRLTETAKLLEALPPEERNALLLFAWEDLGYEEIAVALGVPIGTVRSRLSRARGRLRAGIDEIEHVRAVRPDRIAPLPAATPTVLHRQKERLMQLFSGKVRDMYDVDDRHLLMVVSDRMSAFDVVLAEPVPHKGRVLTALTAFWSAALSDVAPTHVVTADPAQLPEDAASLPDSAGRTTLVRKAEMIAIECIVRGYLSGSAWKEYRTSGTIHGATAPKGLRESDRLPEPVFTPSTKGDAGRNEHDENISFERAAELVGRQVAEEARDISLEYYRRGAEIARERGILIADTKFELGFIDGTLCVCDEILTPDSSRFWDESSWEPGTTPPSFDKQPLRDWLEATGWDKTPPPPAVPDEVIEESSARYVAAYERITGRRFRDWFGVAG